MLCEPWRIALLVQIICAKMAILAQIICCITILSPLLKTEIDEYVDCCLSMIQIRKIHLLFMAFFTSHHVSLTVQKRNNRFL